MNLQLAGSATATPQILLFHGPEFDRGALEPALSAEGIVAHRTDALVDVGWVGESPAVLVIDNALIQGSTDLNAELALLPDSVVLVTTSETVAARLVTDRAVLALSGQNPQSDLRVLRSAYQLSAAKLNAERSQREAAHSRPPLSP